ncbi:hemoglobin subunit beta-1-like [Rhinophrynus dorsalis]
MVHWTAAERQEITSTWSKVCAKTMGGEALARMLCVFPWTQRYFSAFGNLGSAEAICHNAKVLSHGEKVVTSIGEAIKHLDDIKGYYAQLSKYHSENLHVDPANFARFGRVLSIVLARNLGSEYTAEIECALHKFFEAVADALGKGYH